MPKSEKDDDAVRRAIIDSLKKEFLKTSWWGEVQEDVRTRLDWLVEHVDQAGSIFAQTFMSLFRWEFERRKIEGKNVTNPMASYFSTLMGMRITEEAYQCGLLPTRALLDLYDFVRPNDADVAACLFFCHKVEILEKAGMLRLHQPEMKTSPSEMAKLLRSPVKKKNVGPQISEESISWDDENLEE